MENLVLHFSNCVTDGYKIWFASEDFNGLFCGDLKEHAVEYVSSFPNEKFLERYLYWNVVDCKDNMLFVPNRAKQLAVYNRKCNTLRQIPFSDGYSKLYGGCFYDDCVFMCHRGNSGMIKYDLKRDVIMEIFLSDYKEKTDEWYMYWMDKYILLEDIIVLFNNYRQSLVFYCISANKTWDFLLEQDRRKVIDFEIFDRSIVVLYDDGYIVIYRQEEKKLKKQNSYEAKKLKGKRLKFRKRGERLWIFELSDYIREIYELDRETCTLSTMSTKERYLPHKGERAYEYTCLEYYSYGDEYFYQNNSGYFYKDIFGDRIQNPLTFKRSKLSFDNGILDDREVLKETAGRMLAYFINFDIYCQNETENNNMKNIGKKIFRETGKM